MSEWESFYVIVGSSAGALIGIQFVVMTLAANMRERPKAETLDAFSTPTIVHLGGALLVSAIMSAPWHSRIPSSVALAVYGLGGLVYSVVVIWRIREQPDYRPVWQDWVWNAALPCGVYAVLGITAAFFHSSSPLALFFIAGAALGLLFIGIHNAWDAVTHITVTL